MSEHTIIRPATMADLPAACAFYRELIIALEALPYHPRWTLDEYPAEPFLHESIEEGSLYIATVDGNLAAAVVINTACHPGYHEASTWKLPLKPGEFMVIHALGVGMNYQHRGLATRLIDKAFELAREQGLKAVRLDLIDHNYPLEPLYLRYGFTPCGTQPMYHESIGTALFYLYEKEV